jgi:hypothetical protein
MTDPNWPLCEIAYDLLGCGSSCICAIRERFFGYHPTADELAKLDAGIVTMVDRGWIASAEGKYTITPAGADRFREQLRRSFGVTESLRIREWPEVIRG